MQRFFGFIRANRNLLFFGVLLTFFSSFGQTFLISLYIPHLETVFGFSNTGLSSLYALATTASALTLPWVGRYVDTMPLRRFSFGVASGLIIACVLLSFAFHPIVILLGFYGLRLFGQGLMSHTSISTMARAFVKDRGKAISVGTLGHPLGEATLPLIITLVIAAVGWRMSLRISALSLVIFVFPLIYWTLRNQSKSLLFPGKVEAGTPQKSINPFRVVRTKAFWIITPAVFIFGFLNTAIFYYQIKFGESRGWEPSWMAGSLSIYAAAAALSLMGSGPLVDRFTARQLFPLTLIPYVVATIILGYGTHPLSYPLGLIFVAISNGIGSTVKNALFAEVFGIEIIGTVRSVFTMVMVFSTALGPLTFGLFLDIGWSFGQVFLLFAGVLVLIIVWSTLVFQLKGDT